jgi:hypothetical protein
MASDFFEKMQALKDRVGEGELKGTVSFGTPYAWNQHEARWINFMGRYGPKDIHTYHRGGGPKFLSGPMLAHTADARARLGAAFLRALSGVDGALVDEMHSFVDDVKAEAVEAAPIESGRLRESASTSVSDNGAPA